MSETPAETIPIRELPSPATLTRLQLRGVDCVSCGVTLVPGDVVDLGRQVADVFGNEVAWFARTHPRHLGEGAP